jgi:hypothetical protein
MKVRKNGVLFPSAGIPAVGVMGWVAFRLYVRSRVTEVLETEGVAQYFGAANQASGLFNIDLNLPTLSELVKSVVPIWSKVMPTEALLDISQKGRESQYWPSTNRAPSALASFGAEDFVFEALGDAVRGGLE